MLYLERIKNKFINTFSDEAVLKVVNITLIIGMMVILAFFIRTYFGLEFSILNGYSVSGGSDSYYHKRVIDYIVSNHHQLISDPMLNYPVGAIDPRPPFYQWSVVMGGYLLAPFSASLEDAVGLSFILSTAIWGALSIIPLYLIGKEAVNRKVGIIAAFILAISSAHLMRSVSTNADHDSCAMFFMLFTFYFFLKALKEARQVNYISDWKKIGNIKSGLKNFISENKTCLIYAALAGTSLGVIGLMWKGYTYVEAIILIYLAVQILINRFKSQTSLHIIIITIIFTIFSFGLAAPWYLKLGLLESWFIEPLMLMIIMIIVMLFLEISLKYPWVLVFGVTAFFIGLFLVVAFYFLPTLWTAVMSGQGYFAKTKMYSTIAEAQPTTIGRLVMSFNPAIFFLGLAGIGYLIYSLKKEMTAHVFFFIIFALVSIYMAISAARFIFNAAPAFAITGAIMLAKFLDKIEIAETVNNYKRSGSSSSLKATIKKNVKFTHVVAVIMVAFLVILPGVWGAVDSAIPYEKKSEYDNQINDSLPDFMKSKNGSGNWYLGAFGYSIPTEDYPWSRALNWLSTQDTDLVEKNRPAFSSWWDYGFEAIQVSNHPSVADNFQNGYEIAGQILMAQSEKEVISLCIARLLEGDFKLNHKSFSQGVQDILINRLGENITDNISKFLLNPGDYKENILKYPDIYGVYSNDISDQNAKYVLVRAELMDINDFDMEYLIDLLYDLETELQSSIRYFATDYKLFPWSGSNPGIFYAPAKLSDRRIWEGRGTVIPYDFFEIDVYDEDNKRYSLHEFPPGHTITDYKIKYKPMFYNTMLYKTFIGYNGEDIGEDLGIPGFSEQLTSYQPLQGWNMTHFKLVYKTAYWNPYHDYENHSDAWKAVPIQDALNYYKDGIGKVEFPPATQSLPSDVVMVKFYEGAIIEGQALLGDNIPASGVRVTLYDEYGIPHHTTFTDENGYYKLISVAGNNTVLFTTGGTLNQLMLSENVQLANYTIDITEDQATRKNFDKDKDGIVDYLIQKDVTIDPSSVEGAVYLDGNSNDVYDEGEEVEGNITLKKLGGNLEYFANITNGYYSIPSLLPASYDIYYESIYGVNYLIEENITISAFSSLTHDLTLKPVILNGYVGREYEETLAGVKITMESENYDFKEKIYTNETGWYEFQIFPGKYTIHVEQDDYVVNAILNINEWNKTIFKNLTLAKMFEVRGTTYIEGQACANVIIEFKNYLSDIKTKLIESDENSEYEVWLQGGIYTIQADAVVNNIHYTYLKTIEINETKDLDIDLTEAYLLSGNVLDNSDEVDLAYLNVTISSDETFKVIHTNITGAFKIYLSEGDYTVSGIIIRSSSGYEGESRDKTLFGYTSLNLNKDKSITIILSNTTLINGYVSTPTGRNLTEGLIFLKTNGNIVLASGVKSNGEFSLYNKTGESDYSISTWIYGYSYIESVEEDNYTQIYVSMDTVNINGDILYNGVLFDQSFTLQFTNEENSYDVNVVNGKYSYSINPGNYQISILDEDRNYVLENENVTVATGVFQEVLNISLTAKANLTLNGTGTFYIYDENGTEVATGNENQLAVGKYIIYGYTNEKCYLEEIYLIEHTTIDVPFEDGYEMEIIVQEYEPETVIISNSELEFEWNMHSAEITLPAGFYTFGIDEIVETQSSVMQYKGEKDVNITQDGYILISVTSTELKGYVHGSITLNNDMINTYVYFIGNSNTASSKNLYAEGGYSTYLSPGKYTIYAEYMYNTDKYVFLNSLSISNDDIDITYDIALGKGVIVSGVTTLNNQKIYDVTVKINNINTSLEVTSNEIGIYKITLPEGDYTFSAETTIQEYGLDVIYRTSKLVNINDDSNTVDISMERNTIYDLELTWISNIVSTASPGDTVDYTIEMQNNGNDVVVVELKSSDNEWVMEFSENEALSPNEQRTVNVMIEVPDTVNADINNVTIRGLYGDTFTETTVQINVSEYYDFDLNTDDITIIEDYTEYVLKIKNEGNTQDNYTVDIINVEELSEKGWDVKIFAEDEESEYISINAHTTKQIKVKLYATQNNPTYININVEVKGKDDVETVELSMEDYSVSSSAVEITGKDVFIPISEDNSWFIITAIIAVFAISFFILYRRRRG